MEEGDTGLFTSIVDPGSVLEMIHMIEAQRSDEEIQAISRLLDELTDGRRAMTRNDLN